jgi:hypothetical protein
MATFSSMPPEVMSLMIQQFLSSLMKQLVVQRRGGTRSQRWRTRDDLIYEARVLVISFASVSHEMLQQVSYEASRLAQCWFDIDNVQGYVSQAGEDETAILQQTAAYLECALAKLRGGVASCTCGGGIRRVTIETERENHTTSVHKWHTLRISAAIGLSSMKLIQDTRMLFLKNSVSELEYIGALKHEVMQGSNDDLKKDFDNGIWAAMMAELENVDLEEKGLPVEGKADDRNVHNEQEELVILEEVLLLEDKLEDKPL